MEEKPAVRNSPKLLDQVRSAIRRRNYSLRTEQSYVHWIKRLIYFHGVRHPAGRAGHRGARQGSRGRGSPFSADG